jgi:hypothetical protein
MVKVDFWLPPPYLTEIVTDLVAVTGVVVIAKLADRMLAGTVTVEGTVAKLVLLLPKLTVAPTDGAGPVRVTVPIDCVPPCTDVGFKERELSTAAVTVRFAVFVVVP